MLAAVLSPILLLAQSANFIPGDIAALDDISYLNYGTSYSNTSTADVVDDMGYNFSVKETDINSSFSEYPSSFFRNRLVIVSSRKIGAFGKKNKATQEPFAKVFGLDFTRNGSLDRPLLFLGLFNTRHHSQGGIAFAPDEKTVYYTRASEDNPENYQLYIAFLSEKINGLWENETVASFNNEEYSIENPYLTPDGETLYFSSNKPGGFGGYDLYKAAIKEDGTLGITQNLGSRINSAKDERFPSISPDGRNLYLSSNRYTGIGGYDLYRSSILETTYSKPENMGNTLNTTSDDVAFVPVSGRSGYFSSNRNPSKNKNADIYYFNGEITK